MLLYEDCVNDYFVYGNEMRAAFLVSSGTTFSGRFVGAFSATRPGRRRYATTTTMITVDAHVHVWDPMFAAAPTHPLPALTGTAADLVGRMDAAGVDKTLVVQPINYKFDHACVTDAVKRHSGRLYGVALADTALPPADAAKAVAALLEMDGGYYRGVRINPSFAPLASESVAAVLRECGLRNRPACVFARPEHYDELEKVISNSDCNVLIDHFGFASSAEERKKLLALARYPRAHIKASAWFRVSQESHPHPDVQNLLREVVEAFGASRVLVGTDYPYVTEQYGYAETMAAVRTAGLNEAEASMVLGGSASALYDLDK